jgi:hypothetical protein
LSVPRAIVAVVYAADRRDAALALVRQGLSLNQVSARTGISRAAIRVWRDGETRPSATSGCWRCGDLPLPRAYSALLGFYLGDGCLSMSRSVHALRVSCDATYPGIIDDVVRLVEEVHVDGKACLVRAPGVIVVQNAWKHWPCLFPQHGPGRKHTRELGMADWQWEVVRRHPADFLRGLFHSDGSRSRNWTQRLVAGELKRYDYPRWQFTNYSAEIRGWCCDALDLVDVPWRQSNHKTISVSTRAGVARLDELIGLKA